MANPPNIDPLTGEVVPEVPAGAVQIDPATGEVIAPAPKAAPAKEGLLHSLGASLGITPEADQARIDDFKSHPIGNSLEMLLGGPALPALKGMFAGAKRSGGEIIDAGKDLIGGNRPSAAVHAINAIPILGPAMNKGAEQYADKDYLGEAGTLLGGAAQAAPGLLGAIDTAIPGRGVFGQIPSKARASALFSSLDSDLANHPVPLRQTLQPLQRATELGARGGSLPKAASDLLTRSQSPIDMTYPEIRDYQSNLSDLSRDSQGSMNRKMLGQIGNVNKGLYGDIHDAATSAGRGEDYAQAMKEFRQAAQLKDLVRKTAKTAVPVGAAYIGAKQLAPHLKSLF